MWYTGKHDFNYLLHLLINGKQMIKLDGIIVDFTFKLNIYIYN